ncbi:hypothetical protein D3C71_2217170 [compost metagenome]
MHAVGQQAGECVGRAARGAGHEQANRLVGPGGLGVHGLQAAEGEDACDQGQRMFFQSGCVHGVVS